MLPAEDPHALHPLLHIRQVMKSLVPVYGALISSLHFCGGGTAMGATVLERVCQGLDKRRCATHARVTHAACVKNSYTHARTTWACMCLQLCVCL